MSDAEILANGGEPGLEPTRNSRRTWLLRGLGTAGVVLAVGIAYANSPGSAPSNEKSAHKHIFVPPDLNHVGSMGVQGVIGTHDHYLACYMRYDSKTNTEHISRRKAEYVPQSHPLTFRINSHASSEHAKSRDFESGIGQVRANIGPNNIYGLRITVDGNRVWAGGSIDSENTPSLDQTKKFTIAEGQEHSGSYFSLHYEVAHTPGGYALRMSCDSNFMQYSVTNANNVLQETGGA